MDVAELKRLLITSKVEPVKCAVGILKDGAAQISLSKIKSGKALLTEMERDEGKITGPGFGMASVDVDDDPKLVKLTLNRAHSGIGRKLKKTLKGTGFTKVQIMLEDGTVAEAVGEEDEEGAVPQAPAAPPPPPPPPPLPPEFKAAPNPTLTALAAELPGLIKQLQTVITADPSRAATLKGLAAAAVGAVKGTDEATATAAVTALKDGLNAGAPAAAPAAVHYDLKALQAEFAKLVPQVMATPREEAELLAVLRAKAGEIGASLKAGDGAKATQGIEKLRQLLAGGGQAGPRIDLAQPNAKTGDDGPEPEPEHEARPASKDPRKPIEIWREAKETVDAGITALQQACRTQQLAPAVAGLLKEVADKGLNGVTNTASVGMMAAMMEAESSPAAKAKALAAVDKFQSFLDSRVASLIDDNPFAVSIGMRRTFGDALQSIKMKLAA